MVNSGLSLQRFRKAGCVSGMGFEFTGAFYIH